MTVVDTLVLGVLALGLLLGLVKGFVPQVSGLVGLVGGIFLAARYHDALARTVLRPNFPNSDHNGAIAFIAIVVFSVLLVAVIGWLVHKAITKLQLGAYDRLLGAVFGVVKSGLIVAGVLLTIVYFAEDGKDLELAIGSSRSGPMIWKAMHKVVRILPDEMGEPAQDFLDENPLPEPEPAPE